MKIVIHGTKGGHHTFTPEKVKMIDVRPDYNKVVAIGQQAYSINFSDGNLIFSKYRIIRDVIGDKRTGNIAFSIIIPSNEKMLGGDIKELLDKLSEEYYLKYIPNNSNNLDNINEDWSFVKSLFNRFQNRLNNLPSNDIEKFNQGNREAAFIYYSDYSELHKYFDDPYLEEYNTYKQVFFVEEHFKGKDENPLNALRHDPNANLTGKIDLENPKYRLLFNPVAKGGVNIEVKVNESSRPNKSKIRRNNDIEITWSKQFYELKVIRGKWDEISPEYLTINDSQQTITVKEIDLKPISHTFTFETKDRDSNLIKDVEITIKRNGNQPERTALNSNISLTAEDLQYKWIVIAKKGNLISEPKEIKIEDASRKIPLILQERKKVTFKIIDEKNNDHINNCKIRVEGKIVEPKNCEVEFIGDEIYKNWQITVEHRDYETKQFSYCPAKEENTYSVKLAKYHNLGKGPQGGNTFKEKKYCIEIDEQKRKRSYKSKSFDQCVHSEPDYKCEARFGYKFIKWELNKNQRDKEYDGVYKAIFKELWYHRIPKLAWIVISITIALFTIFFLIKTTDTPGSEKPNNSLTKVNSYVDGIELNQDTLKNLKSRYCKEKSPNSLDFCSRLDNAIAIRYAINFGKIDKLKGKTYSEQQQNFKLAIDSIEDNYKNQIGDTLLEQRVSQMNLNEVAILIQKVQKELIEQDQISQHDKNKQQKKGLTHKQKQEQLKTDKTNQQINSLKDEFWKLVNSGNTQKEMYDKLLEKYNDIGGNVSVYLKKICKNSKSFEKFKDIPELDRKSAKKLTELR
jgi:hypothetical protein